MIKKIKRIIICVFLWPVYLLSYLFPRSKKIWVFGSYPGTFIDNSKYLFLKLHLNPEFGITPIWISNNNTLIAELNEKGYRAFHKTSLKGIFYGLKASAFIFSWTVRDINFWISGNAKLISLWHGLPLKRIGKDISQKQKAKVSWLRKVGIADILDRFMYPSQHVTPDVFLSPNSKFYSKIFEDIYEPKAIYHGIYPRIEHFLYSNDKLEQFIDTINTSYEKQVLNDIKNYKDVWIYMPTFRDNAAEDDYLLAHTINFDELNPVLESKGILLLVKYHLVAFKKLKQQQQQYTNIRFLDPKSDVYTIIPKCGGLITDYSSVFFDYLLLNRPIVFYNYDMTQFSKSRALYSTYEEVANGTIITNFNDLKKYFAEVSPDQYADQTTYINKAWGNLDVINTDGFINYILSTR